MTEDELRELRHQMRTEALWTLVQGLYSIVAVTMPNGSQWLRDRFAEIRQRSETVSIPGLKPGWSDMVSAEYRDALNDYLAELEKKLPK